MSESDHTITTAQPGQMSRRHFIAGAALLGMAAAGSTSPAVWAADAKAPAQDRPGPTDIYVDYEWGTLTECFVGIPEVKFPQVSDRLKEMAQVLPKDEAEFALGSAGKWLSEAAPERYAAWVAQMEQLIAVLNQRGVKIHRPRKLTAAEQLYNSEFEEGVTQFFMRDPLLVIGNKVIETTPQAIARRREKFGYRQALEQRLAGSNALYVSMPTALPVPMSAGYGPGPFLEGGDVLLVGSDIYVGSSGNASNEAGRRWLAQFLGPAYRVHEAPLRPTVLHLDCALSLPRPGLCIISPNSFPSRDDIPAFVRDWEWLEVTFDEAQKLACNGLVLSQKSYVMDAEAFPKLADGLAKHGQEVIHVPFTEPARMGGAFRCTHHPLQRSVAVI